MPSHRTGTLFQGNPPWGLIGRVPSLVHSQSVQELILVAPVWRAQAWYPMLLQMLVREPILIPPSPDTIQPVCQNNLPDIIPQLAVWAISAKTATFLRQLQTLYSHHGGINSPNHKTPPLVNGPAGVVNGAEILFQALWCSDVANFRAELYKQGYQYSSLSA